MKKRRLRTKSNIKYIFLYSLSSFSFSFFSPETFIPFRTIPVCLEIEQKDIILMIFVIERRTAIGLKSLCISKFYVFCSPHFSITTVWHILQRIKKIADLRKVSISSCNSKPNPFLPEPIFHTSGGRPLTKHSYYLYLTVWVGGRGVDPVVAGVQKARVLVS